MFIPLKMVCIGIDPSPYVKIIVKKHGENLHLFEVLCGLLNERILERNLRSLAQVQAVPELTWLVDALPSAAWCFFTTSSEGKAMGFYGI